MNPIPCDQCPWRKSNHGRPHRRGFFTKRNRQRLWNQIRGGGGVQSCHLTDPSHPDHVEAGADPNAIAQECPGSVILIHRELAQLASYGEGNVIDVPAMEEYAQRHSDGLKKSGLMYYLVARGQLGGVPFMGGGPKLPENVDVDDEEIGR